MKQPALCKKRWLYFKSTTQKGNSIKAVRFKKSPHLFFYAKSLCQILQRDEDRQIKEHAPYEKLPITWHLAVKMRTPEKGHSSASCVTRVCHGTRVSPRAVTCGLTGWISTCQWHFLWVARPVCVDQVSPVRLSARAVFRLCCSDAWYCLFSAK